MLHVRIQSLSLTLSQTIYFRLFQTERVADDRFIKCDENSRRFSKWVENSVGKGEIAGNEQFLLFPRFSKDLYCRHVNTKGKG